ncbi:MAG TPA: MoxR family ATPase [Lachnospiraceae bacterium]|nr:MoxR family ATPase [Lachnospiraceae bacterium]
MGKEQEIPQRMKEAINGVFIGKEEIVHKSLICLLAGGHLLIEDVPGIGKTTLAGTLAKSTGCSFGRIQFTPDTLPGDITGMSVYNMKSGEFEYRAGVIMHQILLGDEINRTSPKTQSSLLEAMAEGQVTVDGVTYLLPDPFMVIATQNPVEFLGTYPLPEAQMDRFMMRLTIGYPDKEQEILMAAQFIAGNTPDKICAVCGPGDIIRLRGLVQTVTVADSVLEYMEGIVERTRKEERFRLGASPRALLALIRASQGNAFLQERSYVTPDDVKYVADSVLAHRLVLSPEAKIRKEDVSGILRSLILKEKVPV